MTSLRLFALLLASGVSLAAQAGEITVSAAASLSNAFKDIAPLFEAAHPGNKVQLNFGASGALLAQIAKGAPPTYSSAPTRKPWTRRRARGS